jgi:hypothetical protein
VSPDPKGLDTTDGIFAQLEDARVQLGWDLIKLKNTMLTLGLSSVNGYEGGPHNDQKHTQAIADAMQIAHRDDPRMNVLIQNLWQDWVNRGGGPLVYFHGGATASYNGISFGGVNNNTWALREGTLTSSGNAVKDDAFTALQNTPVVATGIEGVTKGTIVLKNVFHSHSGIRDNNNQLVIDNKTKQNSVKFLVTADTTGSHALALDGASTGGSNVDSVALYVDGTLVASGFLPEQNVYVETETLQALATTVWLEAGQHSVEVRLGTVRTGSVGLKNLRLN